MQEHHQSLAHIHIHCCSSILWSSEADLPAAHRDSSDPPHHSSFCLTLLNPDCAYSSPSFFTQRDGVVCKRGAAVSATFIIKQQQKDQASLLHILITPVLHLSNTAHICLSSVPHLSISSPTYAPHLFVFVLVAYKDNRFLKVVMALPQYSSICLI